MNPSWSTTTSAISSIDPEPPRRRTATIVGQSRSEYAVCLAETCGKPAPSTTSAATDRQRVHVDRLVGAQTWGNARSAYAELVNRSGT
ncbi:MAG: hypothetical protein M3460_01860 [Actinomycetota bacterium]|nr:hypothetical protein [Actinomycetota bacterium]